MAVRTDPGQEAEGTARQQSRRIAVVRGQGGIGDQVLVARAQQRLDVLAKRRLRPFRARSSIVLGRRLPGLEAHAVQDGQPGIAD